MYAQNGQKERKSMFKTKQFWCGLSCLGVCVMLIGNSAGTILEKNRNMVNSYLGTQTAVVEVSESDLSLIHI